MARRLQTFGSSDYFKKERRMNMSCAGTLVMPKNYVAMESEEMMYLEGGASWVLEETLTAEDCDRIVKKMGYGATATAAIAAVCGISVATPFIAAIAAGMALAAAHFSLAADGKGMKLYSREIVAGTVNPVYTKEYKREFA